MGCGAEIGCGEGVGGGGLVRLGDGGVWLDVLVLSDARVVAQLIGCVKGVSGLEQYPSNVIQGGQDVRHTRAIWTVTRTTM